MAYTEQIFTDGKTLFAEDLNAMSKGIVEATAPLKVKDGLTVAIIGDSISTHPKKNVCEMTISEDDIGVELSSYITYYDIGKTVSLNGNEDVENATETVTERTLDVSEVEIGSFGSGGGYETESSSTFLIRARTIEKMAITAGDTITFTAGTASNATIRARIAWYSSSSLSSACTSMEAWTTTDTTYTAGSSGYFAILFAKADNSAIVEDDLAAFANSINIHITTTNISEENRYTITSDDVGTELTFNPSSLDVGVQLGTPLNYNSITDVWWQVAADTLGFEPIAATWSGSSITSHTAKSSGKEASYAWHDHTIRKLGKRIAGSMERVGPDVVLVYRGTNDLSHSTKVRLTDGFFDTADWECPTTDVLSDGSTYGYKEGLSILITKIRETYPHAQVVLCTCNVFKRSNYNNFPTNNGYFSIPQMNNAIREVANFFGCHVIELDKCGITFENCYSEGYITDSSTTPTHPNSKGHLMLARQAISDLINKVHIADIEPINS